MNLLFKSVLLVGLIVTISAGTAQVPEAGLVTRESPHDIAGTMTRLEQALDAGGFTVVATVDHSANADSAGLTLPPTYLVIFGNPKAGTPLMQQSRTIGIDLPQKMLVWEDADTVYVAYNDPAYLAERHGLDPQSEGIMKVSAALSGLAEAATAP